MQEESFTSDGIVADTRRGLLDDPKWLSSLYFYDERGSKIFEEICHTPEYYPTRTEDGLLQAYAKEILANTGTPCVVAELGSGSSTKTRRILDAYATAPGARYVPVDVSGDFLANVAENLEAEYPGLRVEPIAEEYHAGLRTIGRMNAPRRLVLFLGSSIGNFEPAEQLGLLQVAFAALSPGDALLLGTDLVKSTSVLEAAYNDSQGRTAAFNRNILRHLNQELGGDAIPDQFAHKAFYNPQKSRIEMHLVSRVAQQVSFPRAKLTIQLQAGETIHTENSYKFTAAGAKQLCEAAGFTHEQMWSDENDWFALHLLRR